VAVEKSFVYGERPHAFFATLGIVLMSQTYSRKGVNQ